MSSLVSAPIWSRVARQRRRPLALRRSRQAAQRESGTLQRLRDRASLIAVAPVLRIVQGNGVAIPGAVPSRWES
jgi:hypothetical protein